MTSAGLRDSWASQQPNGFFRKPMDSGLGQVKSEAFGNKCVYSDLQTLKLSNL